MRRESRLRRTLVRTALAIPLALGSGCLALLAQSAGDWAALARRYSEAANRGGTCEAGASYAAEAGRAAGLASDAAEDAAEQIGLTNGASEVGLPSSFQHPADPAVLARVRMLADSAAPAYNAARSSLQAAFNDFQNPSEEVVALGALTALSLPGAILGAGEVIDSVDEGVAAELDAARSQLDAALGAIEAAEVELLNMRRAMDADGTASSQALEEVQLLRQTLARESRPEFHSNVDGEAESHAYGALHRAAQRTQQLIVGLQRTVQAETARIAEIEQRAGEYGAELHEAEQTAREQAEAARVAAEAALNVCGVAFEWGLEDPLDVAFDQDLSNQGAGGYTPPGP